MTTSGKVLKTSFGGYRWEVDINGRTVIGGNIFDTKKAAFDNMQEYIRKYKEQNHE